jgi:hypothetical protein
MKRLSLLSRLKSSRFCSKQHQQLHEAREGAAQIERLLNAVTAKISSVEKEEYRSAEKH